MNTEIFDNYIAFYGTNDVEEIAAAAVGKIYATGSIAADQNAETAHHIRCIVLRSWGIDVEADYILVTDEKLDQQIDAEIEAKSKIVFGAGGYITRGPYYYYLWFSFEEDVTDAWGEELTLPAALDIQEKVMNEFECNGAFIGTRFNDLEPTGIYFEIS